MPPPNSHRLLIDEPPLMVLPSLAAAIGLNEAIVIQQLHYWLGRSGKERDGRQWIYNSYPDWEQQFPFWSNKTIRRIIGSLESSGLILSANYNNSAFDKTKWYTIDYAALATAVDNSTQAVDNSAVESPPRSGQIDHIDQPRKGSPDRVIVTRPIPETNTENTIREQQQDPEELLFIGKITQLLEHEGISPKTALELATADPDLAADWLEAKQSWKNARDPAGLLVSKLRAKEQAPKIRRLFGSD
jgi:hypothetical protein